MAFVLRTRPRLTVRDYLARPEEFGVELIEGEFVMTPAPNTHHQEAVGRLYRELSNYLDRTREGKLFLSPTDVILAEDLVLQPDLSFVSRDRLQMVRDQLHGPPDLVIEVLSDTTRVKDRFVKRDKYARFGVREYWIVDPSERSVEVLVLVGHQYVPHALFEGTARLSTPLFPDLKIPVDTIWT
jgi:Uma2 family endonuclease